ncbi:MAG: 2-oxo-4-hydroxy-4-carboxy-5-ureidoimidazoline decarboxylase [Gammaproteobacteria bacterium]|nr:2-oxo-4-hydroxy-4-carboxy-5-ureidoimidazoline decarboxylase [Gammaproteobacteria bacterium]
MSEAEFVQTFGGIYEHSPWVARGTRERGLDERHDTVEGLAEALAATVDMVDEKSRLALIRAHPDLAGRAAVRGELGEASSREQAGAGIDQCTPEEYDRFQYLNDAYKRRFGFPFVMAVKGSNRRAILAAFEERLANDAAAELERAIAEIHRIARFRLNDLSDPSQRTE